MSKLNPKNVRSSNIVAVAAKRGEKLGFSANGNLQFKKEPLQQLYELVVMTMFGKSPDAQVARIKAGVRAAVDMGANDFIANLAIHARTEMNVRTIPLVVVVEFAKALSDKRQPILDEIKRLEAHRIPGLGTNKTNAMRQEIADLRIGADVFNYTNMRQLVADVIQRADQITDLYALALATFGDKTKIPMAIKRGVADAFNKFGAYAFAKYNRAGAVKFRDVLRIVHPEAKSVSQGQIFDKIMKETLEAPYTWEVQLSENGQRVGRERLSDRDIWTQLVTSGKMGYMALLRNLRNIHQAGLDSDVLREHVLNVISDPVQVANSKQLPYDFMEAYNVLKGVNPKMATAISKAIDLSVSNIPQMGEKIWFIIDYSGSMGQESQETSAFSSGIFLASALLKANADSDRLAVTIFGSGAKTLKGVDTNNSMIAIQKDLISHRKGDIAGSTNFGAALLEKSKIGFEPDTIIVITDNEVNKFPYGVIQNIAGRKTAKLTVNMQASFTTPMPKSDGWFTMAGWSPAMFKWVPAMRDAADVVDQLSLGYTGLPEKPARVTADE